MLELPLRPSAAAVAPAAAPGASGPLHIGCRVASWTCDQTSQLRGHGTYQNELKLLDSPGRRNTAAY